MVNLAVMFPMISRLEEFEQAKEVVEECKAELRAEGKAYSEKFNGVSWLKYQLQQFMLMN